MHTYMPRNPPLLHFFPLNRFNLSDVWYRERLYLGALRLQAPFNILFFKKVAGLGKANTLKRVINRDKKK